MGTSIKKKSWGLNWDSFLAEALGVQEQWNSSVGHDGLMAGLSRGKELKEFAHTHNGFIGGKEHEFDGIHSGIVIPDMGIKE